MPDDSSDKSGAENVNSDDEKSKETAAAEEIDAPDSRLPNTTAINDNTQKAEYRKCTRGHVPQRVNNFCNVIGAAIAVANSIY